MHQRRIWSDPRIVAERREPAEAVLGREMEMPGRKYSEVERRIAAAHLAMVAAETVVEEDLGTA